MTAMGMILGLALLAGGACTEGEVAYRPSPEESSVPELFRLKPEAYRYELEPVLSTPRYTVSRLRFPSPIATADAENNTVHAEYFEPRGGTPGGRPAVVVLHILGADFPLSRYLAARLADRGVAALFVKLPYYGERRPRGGPGPVPTKFLSSDMERTMTSMRQGVCDVRRGLGWLASRPGNDPARLGVVGISLGGIVGSVAVAVDPSASRGAFLLAGGDLSKILWDMPETAKFRQSWEASGRTIRELKALTDPFDPLTYASRLKGKDVLMIAGNVDEVVPPASTRALWEAAGRPPILWYDCGHYSAVGYLLPGIRRAVDFLAAPGPPPRPRPSRG
ncbi:Alpha/beta hydrolase family protein [Aquisphaera giovannonii]|uniref:Alpha/beta hydrolase family protein n=1 Tax=Aquisphaera giovannonii TaxID=406548 RepID=A0A5B9WAZ6_9BACT|nr:alpha/beta hydrolase family protein [Aquisphaera giovannonii]QEH37647.1 Alpha/beta hydrolase family protein [Aquisphaera giovannonii]